MAGHKKNGRLRGAALRLLVALVLMHTDSPFFGLWQATSIIFFLGENIKCQRAAIRTTRTI